MYDSDFCDARKFCSFLQSSVLDKYIYGFGVMLDLVKHELVAEGTKILETNTVLKEVI